jgi:hypothetical protein
MVDVSDVVLLLYVQCAQYLSMAYSPSSTAAMVLCIAGAAQGAHTVRRHT